LGKVSSGRFDCDKGIQAMAHGTSVPDDRRTGRLSRAIVLLALILFGLALAAAVGLWLHYGSTVFFQMLVAGIAACF
jgi:hypothetical protein